MNTENNKIIQEFMNHYENMGNRGLLYHSDWNWLMEVVEKIESLEFEVFIETYEVRIELYNNTIFRQHTKVSNQTKIQAVYNACVEFIKWYNEQK